MTKFRFAVLVYLTALVLGAAAQPASADEAFALRFDGTTDSVRLGATASMLPAGWATTKTVTLWVKPEGTPVCTAQNPGSCDVIFGDRPRTWGISRGVIGGSNRIWVWNYDGTFDSVGIQYDADEWVHIALVHGGGLLRAYKDGILVGSVASGPTASSEGTTLYFGGIINNASKNWTFEGEIDEVRIWGLALSAADVSQELDGPLDGSETGLAAYYRMTNGSGTSLTDDSVHSWTGTLLDGGSGVPGNGPIEWVEPGIFGDGGGTPNTPPVADPQDRTLAEDVPLSITLTGSDADDDDLTFEVVDDPAHGTLSGTPPSLVYTPHANFYGADSFTFIADDGRDTSEPATVSLTITPVNDAPVAQPDSETTDMDLPVIVDVLDNDFDIDGDTLIVSEVGNALNGVTENEGTHVVYTPNPDFVGSDAFSYTVSDGNGGTATALVSIMVTLTGEGPGYALRFDGASDYVKLHATSALMAPGWENTKTVSLWVKPTGDSFCNAPSPASCDAIFGDRPRWWGISRGVIGELDRIWVWNYDGNLDAIAIPYTPGQWMHVAMVHDAGTLKAYKNGDLIGSVASGTTQQPITGASPVLHFGGVINTAARNWTFKGDIDEVQIWNIARSGAEIAAGMNSPLLGTEPGLAAYYSMSDGSGDELTDDSGQGFTGELHDGGQGVPGDGEIEWVPSGAFFE